jgi:predicted glutamate--cysteine ligase
VPLFDSHRHYIQWTEEQLVLGTMQNVRHLWSAVRPNGDRRPYNLNRLELRISDLITDPIALLAITALLEARLTQLMEDPSLDPLVGSSLTAEDLVALTDANELAAARRSLDAELRHWKDGSPILARDWIAELYEEVWGFAKSKGFSCFLAPLKKILREGNEAQRWLKKIDQGLTPDDVITQAIKTMESQEAALSEEVCQPLVA